LFLKNGIVNKIVVMAYARTHFGHDSKLVLQRQGEYFFVVEKGDTLVLHN
jgi:hypothetical protein